MEIDDAPGGGDLGDRQPSGEEPAPVLRDRLVAERADELVRGLEGSAG